jgi:outer membrane protein assembly factor BamB
MFLALLLTCIPQIDELAQSWSRFRGPNGNGQASGLWTSGKHELKEAWKVELAGKGYSSPIVQAGRIYLQSATADGRERLIQCLSIKDGKTLWQKTVPGSRAHTHAKNSLASGSAATDGKLVLFCLWDGKNVSLAAFACEDGTPRWSVPLGSHQSQHGAGYSPILHQGKAYVAFDNDHKAEVFCVEVATGKKLWSKDRQHFRASYGTPLIYSNQGKDELVVSSTAGVTGYELDTGAQRWHWDWPFATKPLRSVSSPLLCLHHILLAAAGDGGGDRDTVAVKLPEGRGSQYQPRLLWQLRRDVPYVTCLLQQGEHLFAVADKGVASCLELTTGKEVWSQRLGGNFTGSPLLVDGSVIGVNETGEVFVFAASPQKYQPLGRFKLNETVLTTPAVAEGMLLIRGEQHLFALRAAP